ncbi:DUF6228 family protein [Spirillospora sp. NPDC048819]|uniref:DUF6228 family protein n=1 Tax=Spirillospora sp. NPDC048819 TaxID=3155268 RepID=UPI0033F5F64D
MTSNEGDADAVQVPSGPTGTFVRFSSCRRPYGDDVLIFTVEAEGPGLSAAIGVTTVAGDGLVEFLQSLDDDFRGWPGKRTWTSLANELELSATHQGQSVDLQWTLRFPQEPGTGVRCWIATLTSLFSLEKT